MALVSSTSIAPRGVNNMWILILLHLFLVFGGTYFLSPELTVYPYLVSRGLQPYINIIDQHFPLLFYGPLNLTQLNLITPQSTQILFVLVIIATDLFAFLSLKKRPFVFLSFILIQFLLGGNTLWIESFVLLFIAGYFYFNDLNFNWSQIVGGLFLSLSLGLRPTLVPFVLLLVIFTSKNKLKTLLLLPIIPLVEIIWLLVNHLWNDFYQLMFFNAEIYTRLSLVLPSRNEIIIFLLAITPLLILGYSAKKFIPTSLLILSLLVLGYPRFDLSDLLPIAGIIIYFSTAKLKKIHILIIPWIIIILGFIFIKKFAYKPNNFYYPASIYQSADRITKLNKGQPIYLFGGPDQLYVLTKTSPTGDYYLPSLPWYFAQKNFVDQELSALKQNPQDLVVVNQQSLVGGVSLLDYGQPIWQYIQANYSKIDTINNLDIYENRH